jgi:NADH:ubiquinone oxidoreductase subunit
MGYSEARRLPIPYRRWFLNRLSEEFKKQAENHKQRDRDRSSERGQRVQELPMGEMNLESQRRESTRTEKKFK